MTSTREKGVTHMRDLRFLKMTWILTGLFVSIMLIGGIAGLFLLGGLVVLVLYKYYHRCTVCGSWRTSRTELQSTGEPLGYTQHCHHCGHHAVLAHYSEE